MTKSSLLIHSEMEATAEKTKAISSHVEIEATV